MEKQFTILSKLSTTRVIQTHTRYAQDSLPIESAIPMSIEREYEVKTFLGVTESVL